ncbi:hypothetical protein DDB_G0270720 [Dictyostelium discoideum AX4]|uniref:Major facilitator superfamily associated domain-containing protein n=1 Tax=Dictyostelium discoideum TaxID=44689 RepID=Q55CH3_DICDI|nr:hypothetical protein DDB_G0270720 [Dictyostelium discoideum AX4]EAL72710.1 hypothetical protein DDB_G0270720 [Dictyostelium discoideum AX4]|eukprot:XP_646508.1 hypothetical protein DDB_G0270720 [Dictyostelium discoideum AX4]
MVETILSSFKRHTNLKILYFFQSASIACFQPFISIYLRDKELKPSIIGIITCLIPLISFISSPIWSNISDRFGIQKKVVIFNLLISMVALLLLIPNGNNVVGIFFLIILYSIVTAPLCPIIDSLVIKDLGEDSKLYGQQRLFGAISYGIVAFLTGILINHYNINFIHVFYAFWVMVFLVFYIFNQTNYGSKLKITKNLKNPFIKLNDNEKTPVGDEIEIVGSVTPNGENIISNENLIVTEINNLENDNNNNNNSNLGEAIISSDYKNNQNDNGNDVLLEKEKNNFINNQNDNENTIGGDVKEESNENIKLTNKQVFKNILKNPQMMIFLLAMAICGMTYNIINSFLFIFLRDHLKASNFLLGSTMPFTVVMELPFFFFGKQLLEKVGVTKMIMIGHTAFILRLCLYNIFVIDSISPWFILPIETLHGIAFATIWGAGVEFSSKMAPRGYETFYQGIFTGLYSGLGSCIGSILGGFIYEHKSAFYLFRFNAIITTTSLIIFSLTQFFYSKEFQKFKTLFN